MAQYVLIGGNDGQQVSLDAAMVDVRAHLSGISQADKAHKEMDRGIVEMQFEACVQPVLPTIFYDIFHDISGKETEKKLC